VRSIVSIEDIEMLQSQVKRMTISDEVRDYIVEIGEATRRNPAIRLGASPRAIQMLAKLSRAWALLNDGGCGDH